MSVLGNNYLAYRPWWTYRSSFTNSETYNAVSLFISHDAPPPWQLPSVIHMSRLDTLQTDCDMFSKRTERGEGRRGVSLAVVRLPTAPALREHLRCLCQGNWTCVKVAHVAWLRVYPYYLTGGDRYNQSHKVLTDISDLSCQLIVKHSWKC